MNQEEEDEFLKSLFGVEDVPAPSTAEQLPVVPVTQEVAQAAEAAPVPAPVVLPSPPPAQERVPTPTPVVIEGSDDEEDVEERRAEKRKADTVSESSGEEGEQLREGGFDITVVPSENVVTPPRVKTGPSRIRQMTDAQYEAAKREQRRHYEKSKKQKEMHTSVEEPEQQKRKDVQQHSAVEEGKTKKKKRVPRPKTEEQVQKVKEKREKTKEERKQAKMYAPFDDVENELEDDEGQLRFYTVHVFTRMYDTRFDHSTRKAQVGVSQGDVTIDLNPYTFMSSNHVCVEQKTAALKERRRENENTEEFEKRMESQEDGYRERCEKEVGLLLERGKRLAKMQRVLGSMPLTLFKGIEPVVVWDDLADMLRPPLQNWFSGEIPKQGMNVMGGSTLRADLEKVAKDVGPDGLFDAAASEKRVWRSVSSVVGGEHKTENEGDGTDPASLDIAGSDPSPVNTYRERCVERHFQLELTSWGLAALFLIYPDLEASALGPSQRGFLNHSLCRKVLGVRDDNSLALPVLPLLEVACQPGVDRIVNWIRVSTLVREDWTANGIYQKYTDAERKRAGGTSKKNRAELVDAKMRSKFFSAVSTACFRVNPDEYISYANTNYGDLKFPRIFSGISSREKNVVIVGFRHDTRFEQTAGFLLPVKEGGWQKKSATIQWASPAKTTSQAYSEEQQDAIGRFREEANTLVSAEKWDADDKRDIYASLAFRTLNIKTKAASDRFARVVTIPIGCIHLGLYQAGAPNLKKGVYKEIKYNPFACFSFRSDHRLIQVKALKQSQSGCRKCKSNTPHADCVGVKNRREITDMVSKTEDLNEGDTFEEKYRPRLEELAQMFAAAGLLGKHMADGKLDRRNYFGGIGERVRVVHTEHDEEIKRFKVPVRSEKLPDPPTYAKNVKGPEKHQATDTRDWAMGVPAVAADGILHDSRLDNKAVFSALQDALSSCANRRGARFGVAAPAHQEFESDDESDEDDPAYQLAKKMYHPVPAAERQEGEAAAAFPEEEEAVSSDMGAYTSSSEDEN